MIEKEISTYEKQSLLEQYLLFHYGDDKDLMPYSFGPQNALHFPVKCVHECLDAPSKGTALDLGCAVGRSSFELSRFFDSVVGIDKSQAFISAAKEIQDRGEISYSITEQGTNRSERTAKIPLGSNPKRVSFHCSDVMEIFTDSKQYDFILAANLICRLEDPMNFLNLLHEKVVKGGQLVIASPYSWLEEFTPKHRWPQDCKNPLNFIQEALGSKFSLQRTFDIPFLIREHARKYQWGVSQCSVWHRH